MSLRTSITIAMIIGTATSTAAAPLTLLSAGLNSAGGDMTCHVMNGGKKTVDQITVAIAPVTQPDNGSSLNCQQVAAGAGCPATIGVGNPGSYFCKVTISKGSKKDFRAVFCDITSGSCSEAR